MPETTDGRTDVFSVNRWERCALVVSLIMLGGSLYLSLGMQLKACPLCLYERSFVMAVAGLLATGAVLRLELRSGTLSLLSLPLATAGLGLAAFHVYLDRFGVLDCPAGLLGWGNAPDQSLAGYLVLTALLMGGGLANRLKGWQRGLGIASGLIVGSVLAFSAVKSAPPLPPPNPQYAEDGRRILSGCEPAAPMQQTESPPPG